MKPRVIVNIIGARPNFIKIAPLHHQMLARPGLRPMLVHTGQHYDQTMSNAFIQDLALPEPDRYLSAGSGTHAEQTAAVMISLEKVLMDIRPDVMVVVGDVNSTLAAALVAAKLLIPIAHVEAGLRSNDRTMPEEVNRMLTDALSEYLFVTEESGLRHLRQEGIADEKIHFTGNVMIDSLVEHLEMAENVPILERLQVTAREFGLITLHRPVNVDDREHLGLILTALEVIEKDLMLVFPMHPRVQKMLTRFGFEDRIRAMKNLKIMPPLGYLAFLRLMSQARWALTDSGGIQEETTFLDIPCLTLRNRTERPVTVELGTNRLVPLEIEAIINAARAAMDGEFRRKQIPPLWDGRASERIVDVLAR
jgi:UDP-N-acetylglucosamine 2-epimerase (non-hydrolysing)